MRQEEAVEGEEGRRGEAGKVKMERNEEDLPLPYPSSQSIWALSQGLLPFLATFVSTCQRLFLYVAGPALTPKSQFLQMLLACP